jgi:transcriptional regulator with XRE-family HTH domain
MAKNLPINNIRAERVRKGLTQKEMAKKLGLSAVSYNQKEGGKIQFRLDEFIQICHVLDTDPETLLKGSV